MTSALEIIELKFRRFIGLDWSSLFMNIFGSNRFPSLTFVRMINIFFFMVVGIGRVILDGHIELKIHMIILLDCIEVRMTRLTK